MPSNLQNRANSVNAIQHQVITDNPVFKVKLRGLATGYEQGAQQNDRTEGSKDYSSKFKVGDTVSGKSYKTEYLATGEVVKIDKNEDGDAGAIIVLDEKSKKRVRLDPTTCKKIEKEDHGDKKGQHEVIGENQQFLSFSEFLLTI